FKPTSLSGDARDTPIGQLAADIPGLAVMIDEDGREAELFQARTSGQSALYDAQGRLAFRGGITASRGHAGDNPGRSAIEGLLHAGTAGANRTAVFGCALSK